jgi:hypothetical protein
MKGGILCITPRINGELVGNGEDMRYSHDS